VNARFIAGFAALVLVASAIPAQAGPMLDDAVVALSHVEDYTDTLTVHETSGTNSDDHTYNYAFKKPNLVKLDVTSGSNKGGGIVWTGGDKVSGHRGGFLSGIHLKLDLHDKQVVSLRGDSIDTGTFAAMLDRMKTIKGELTEAAGPALAGVATDAVSLRVADPTANKGVTREVLYLSKTTHLPLRREQYVGDAVVKTETVSNLKTNVGLQPSDFPF